MRGVVQFKAFLDCVKTNEKTLLKGKNKLPQTSPHSRLHAQEELCFFFIPTDPKRKQT